MARVTYYVALPFIRGTDGSLIPGEAMECQSQLQAIARADRFARDNAGGVAFSRTGDPSLGDFDPATILHRAGDVPEDLSEL